MRRLFSALFAACVLFAGAAPARAHGPDIVPAGAEVVGAAWEEAIAGQVPHPPGTCTRFGRRDVFLVHPDKDLRANCTIAPGDRLLVFFGTFCASWEGTIGPRVQRQCAIESDQAILRFPVSVDGRGLDIRTRRFEVLTGWRWLWLPAGNSQGVEPQIGNFVAHGWSAFVEGLRRGVHSVVYVVDAPAWGGPFTFTVTVEVR
jgi:hypothetical protein